MMAKVDRKNFEAELVDYLVKEYFGGKNQAFADKIFTSRINIERWRSGETRPQKDNLRNMLAHAFVPEIKVVAEYCRVELTLQENITPVLKKVLAGHENKPGIYAFYDSMCNVIYVGKAASSLFKEMYQQLGKPLGIKFPNAVKSGPTRRWQAVQYVSAYEVPKTGYFDYSKHVESLILRISKPAGNKVLGNLKSALVQIDS